MPRGKPSPKLAITVDADVHDRVLEAAATEGVSVSAWMTRAARRALLARDGLAAIAEWEAQHGPLTGAEMAAGGRVPWSMSMSSPPRIGVDSEWSPQTRGTSSRSPTRSDRASHCSESDGGPSSPTSNVLVSKRVSLGTRETVMGGVLSLGS